MKAYLSKWIRVFARPSILRLIRAHCDLGVSSAFQGTLVDVCRPQYHILVIDYHSFGMDIDHKPPVSPGKCLGQDAFKWKRIKDIGK